MTKNNSDEDGYIPIDEDKLKEDQKAEVQQATERFRRECLKSFSTTRSGEIIKKFDFPALQPLTEAKCENKMLDAVHQAVNHAFINHAPVMTHTVHNTVVKTLGERAFKGYEGPLRTT
jgi:predicted Ser/Thr protein kinase